MGPAGGGWRNAGDDTRVAAPDSSDAIAFEIYSGEGEAATVHSQGRAVLAAAEAAPVVDLAALRARVPEAILPAEQVYAAFERMGLRYGASFRGVRQLMRSRDASGAVLVLGELHLPAALRAHQGDYVLHPSLLDAALQASLGLAVEGGGETLLPFALDRLEVYAALPEAVWVLVRPRSGETNGLLHKLDLELVDEGGRVCARLTGFTSRVLERSGPSETRSSLSSAPVGERRSLRYGELRRLPTRASLAIGRRCARDCRRRYGGAPGTSGPLSSGAAS